MSNCDDFIPDRSSQPVPFTAADRAALAALWENQQIVNDAQWERDLWSEYQAGGMTWAEYHKKAAAGRNERWAKIRDKHKLVDVKPGTVPAGSILTVNASFGNGTNYAPPQPATAPAIAATPLPYGIEVVPGNPIGYFRFWRVEWRGQRLDFQKNQWVGADNAAASVLFANRTDAEKYARNAPCPDFRNGVSFVKADDGRYDIRSATHYWSRDSCWKLRNTRLDSRGIWPSLNAVVTVAAKIPLPPTINNDTVVALAMEYEAETRAASLAKELDAARNATAAALARANAAEEKIVWMRAVVG